MTRARGTSRAKKNSLTPLQCEMPGCGYDTLIQRHRIIPGREGGKYVIGNVIALCPNHHAEADRGQIPNDLLYCIVTERIARDANTEVGDSTFEEVGSSSPEA